MSGGRPRETPTPMEIVEEVEFFLSHLGGDTVAVLRWLRVSEDVLRLALRDQDRLDLLERLKAANVYTPQGWKCGIAGCSECVPRRQRRRLREQLAVAS